MIKKRLSALENIIARRGAGSNADYLQAVKRVTACIRLRIEYILYGRKGPEPESEDPKDIDTIRDYESLNHITHDNGARQRVEDRLNRIRERICYAKNEESR